MPIIPTAGAKMPPINYCCLCLHWAPNEDHERGYCSEHSDYREWSDSCDQWLHHWSGKPEPSIEPSH